MPRHPTTPSTPVRRDLTDPRSAAASGAGGRKTLLNDRRSTR